MANRLKMAIIHAIIGLLEQGWSYRCIARELRVDRETVARYDHLRRNRSNAAISTPGSLLGDLLFPVSGHPPGRDTHAIKLTLADVYDNLSRRENRE